MNKGFRTYEIILNGALQDQQSLHLRALLSQAFQFLGGVKAGAYLFRVSNSLAHKWVEPVEYGSGTKNFLDRTALLLQSLVTSHYKTHAIRIANVLNGILGGFFISKEAIEGIEKFIREARERKEN